MSIEQVYKGLKADIKCKFHIFVKELLELTCFVILAKRLLWTSGYVNPGNFWQSHPVTWSWQVCYIAG